MMKQKQNYWPALIAPRPRLVGIAPSPAVIVSLLANKIAPNVPNNILKNPPFCSFASFLIF